MSLAGDAVRAGCNWAPLDAQLPKTSEANTRPSRCARCEGMSRRYHASIVGVTPASEWRRYFLALSSFFAALSRLMSPRRIHRVMLGTCVPSPR